MLGCSPLAFDPLATCTPQPLPTNPTVDISPAGLIVTPGNNVTVTVVDLDRIGQGALAINLDVQGGDDTEDIILTETSPAVFTATIPTNGLAAGVPNDGEITHSGENFILTATVQEQGGGTVTATATLISVPPPVDSLGSSSTQIARVRRQKRRIAVRRRGRR